MIYIRLYYEKGTYPRSSVRYILRINQTICNGYHTIFGEQTSTS